MVKSKTVYVCSECGMDSPKWVGRCPSCGAWNTMKEMTIRPETNSVSNDRQARQALAILSRRESPTTVSQRRSMGRTRRLPVEISAMRCRTMRRSKRTCRLHQRHGGQSLLWRTAAPPRRRPAPCSYRRQIRRTCADPAKKGCHP